MLRGNNKGFVALGVLIPLAGLLVSGYLANDALIRLEKYSYHKEKQWERVEKQRPGESLRDKNYKVITKKGGGKMEEQKKVDPVEEVKEEEKKPEQPKTPVEGLTETFKTLNSFFGL